MPPDALSTVLHSKVSACFVEITAVACCWWRFVLPPAVQAKVTQQANLMAGKRSAPIWALAAIMFLGWNEFMAVLWNPIYLIVGLLTFVFGYQMYNELDVDAELQRGWVMGGMNIWNKLGDVMRTVSRGLRVGLGAVV